MATVVNNPGTTTADSGSSIGMMIGFLLLVALVVLLFIYGIPALRAGSGGGTSVTPQFNVPGKVDVNVKGNK